MRRGPEDPRPRSLLATSASRAPEQLRLAHPRSVVAGKARCRRTLDALSAPMGGGSRKAPARPCIDDSHDPERRRHALCRRALFAAVDGQPRQTCAPYPPRAQHPPPPRAHDRRYAGRHCCHASAKDRRSRPQWSGAHGADAAGRSRVDRPTLVDASRQPSAVNRPAISVQRSPDLRSPGQDGRLKPTPRDRGPWRRSLHGRARPSDASCQHESPRFRDA